MNDSSSVPYALWQNIARVLAAIVMLMLTCGVGIVGYVAKDAHSENRERIADIQYLRENTVKRPEFEIAITKIAERADRIQREGIETRSALDEFRGEAKAKLDFIITTLTEIKAATVNKSGGR